MRCYLAMRNFDEENSQVLLTKHTVTNAGNCQLILRQRRKSGGRAFGRRGAHIPSLLFLGRGEPVEEDGAESQLFSSPGIVLNLKDSLSSRAGDAGDESVDPSMLCAVDVHSPSSAAAALCSTSLARHLTSRGASVERMSVPEGTSGSGHSSSLSAAVDRDSCGASSAEAILADMMKKDRVDVETPRRSPCLS